MKITYEYSRKWRFNFNYDKCAIIIFNGQKIEEKYGNCVNVCTCNKHWTLGKTLIKQVNVYKYLGIELDYNLSFLDFKKRIVDKVRQNKARLWKMGKGELSVRSSINLWDALGR